MDNLLLGCRASGFYSKSDETEYKNKRCGVIIGFSMSEEIDYALLSTTEKQIRYCHLRCLTINQEDYNKIIVHRLEKQEKIVNRFEILDIDKEE